ncbi:FMN-linked oxidoreductase [Ramicandelaber brevisporus]|nr:FMN-linked oxidoreductase [Ramicandelaber brevisporus]
MHHCGAILRLHHERMRPNTQFDVNGNVKPSEVGDYLRDGWMPLQPSSDFNLKAQLDAIEASEPSDSLSGASVPERFANYHIGDKRASQQGQGRGLRWLMGHPADIDVIQLGGNDADEMRAAGTAIREWLEEEEREKGFYRKLSKQRGGMSSLLGKEALSWVAGNPDWEGIIQNSSGSHRGGDDNVPEWERIELNINCGCPSDRVQRGCFGALLMKDPALVAELCQALHEGSRGMKVSIKCRIGVDDLDSYDFVRDFIKTVSTSVPFVNHFVVHARKCILKGLNPKQNRTIPPINHERVYALAQEFPHLLFTINGEVREADSTAPSPPSVPAESATAVRRPGAVQHLAESGIDGVMLGRRLRDDPFEGLREWETAWYHIPVASTDHHSYPSREDVLAAYLDYTDVMEKQGHSFGALTRPLLSFFNGHAGRAFRKELTGEEASKLRKAAEMIMMASAQHANPRRQKKLKHQQLMQKNQPQCDDVNDEATAVVASGAPLVRMIITRAVSIAMRAEEEHLARVQAARE